MTAQIGDIYKYKEKNYTIVALSSPMLFEPQQYGLVPHSSSTACWRGYWCEYVVADDKLLLEDLYIYNEDGNYPPLCGVEVSPAEFEEHECYVGGLSKRKKVLLPAHDGHRVYKKIDLPIPFTGKILLGSGFMSDYYIHMRFHRSWAYKELIEFEFCEGQLVTCTDLSHVAKAQREAIKQQRIDQHHPYDGNIPKYIEDCFSLDYSIKAWWMDN